MPSTYQPITERVVARLKGGDSSAAPNTFVRDPSIIGFAILVNRNSAAYIVEGRAGRGGRNVRYSLGRVGRLDLDEARKQAKEKLAVLGRGVDLIEQHRETVIQNTMAKLSVADALALALALEHRLKAGTAADYVRSIKRLGWEKRQLASINAADVRKRFGELGGRAQASRIMRVLRRVWNVAREKHPNLPANPVPTLKTVSKGWARTRRKQRVIADGLLPEWRRAVDNLERDDVRDLILFCFYVGCRISEARALTVEDLNDCAKSFVFRDPKNRLDLELPVTRQLAPILARRAEKVKSGLLFAQGDLRKSFAATIAIAPWSWHDLRRLFISAADRAGVPDQFARKLTNHAVPDDDSHGGYKVFPADVLRPYAQQVADFLDRLAAPKGSKIVPLKRRTA